MRYVDQLGRNISLGRKLGTGGEGAVFEIGNSSDYVAKIYHKAATNEKASKLAAMLQLATPEIVKFAAWPKGTLHQWHGGPAVGIILPRVKDSHEIHELYSPAHRKVRFPLADWRFLIRTARNCAAAFATLHGHNIVVGDVNQGNLFVSQRAVVNLIDCDSFQVSANGRLFRCPVGVAHFVPPELQNSRLPDVIRTANHDNFGLAIVIFHLLFMGRHPFAGRYSGSGDMPIENAIREFRFAYSSSARRFQMAPPPSSVTLSHLPQELAVLFERAFAHGSELPNARPTPHAWAQSLDQLERHLCQCQHDPGHFYPTLLRGCPWCEIIRTGGPNFFISVTIQSVVARSASFDLAGTWAQIQAVPRPDALFAPAQRYPTNQMRPRPLPSTDDDNRPIRNAIGIIGAVGGALTLLSCLYAPLALFSIPICVIFVVWWIVLKLNSPLAKLKHERRAAHNTTKHELDRARANQRSVAQRYLHQFQAKIESLHHLKARYEQLKAQRDAELHDLHQQVQQRQLEEHLRQCFISSANISGIGPVRVATLESYGIETALDIVQRTVLNVPGFGEVFTQKLLNWRRQKERAFRFDPSKGVPQSDIQTLEMKYAQQRSQCERQFQYGPHELRQIANAGKAEVERLDAVVAHLEYEFAQATVDLRVFDDIPWWH